LGVALGQVGCSPRHVTFFPDRHRTFHKHIISHGGFVAGKLMDGARATGVNRTMRVHEILSTEPLPVMSYSRKKAESVITGLEKTINDHLLKLLVVEDDQSPEHWTNELLEWLDEVAEIRLKPENKTGQTSFYYRILFDEPFGGTGVLNVARRIRRLERQGYKVRDADLDNVLQQLRQFHNRFSEACNRGVEADEIAGLLAQMTS
jgi:hypothetical protein